jgi:hypothetical protein
LSETIQNQTAFWEISKALMRCPATDFRATPISLQVKGVASQQKKRDQADAVIRVTLPPGDDLEACVEAIKPALHKAGEEIDRVNATRKGKRKLRAKIEFAFLDAAGTREFVFPTSGDAQWHHEKEIDPRHFPNFA